eukprot:2188597-Prymnesium_polylepis.2
MPYALAIPKRCAPRASWQRTQGTQPSLTARATLTSVGLQVDIKRFCIAHGTPWMRPRLESAHWDELREATFYSLAIVWISMMMLPSARTRQRGFTQAKPDSTMNALRGYRRVQTDCGRQLAQLDTCLKQLKAQRAAYLNAWGDDALVPQRAQPFELQQLLLMLTTAAS